MYEITQRISGHYTMSGGIGTGKGMHKRLSTIGRRWSISRIAPTILIRYVIKEGEVELTNIKGERKKNKSMGWALAICYRERYSTKEHSCLGISKRKVSTRRWRRKE